MTNVSQWSTAAAGNNDQPPDGWPEGQAPSTVNNSGREVMAAVRRWYEDTSAKLTTGGVADAYTLTTASAHATLADQSLLAAILHATNTGASTLDVDALGPTPIKLPDGSDPPAGALAAGSVALFAYEPGAGVYVLVGGRALGTVASRDVGTANGQIPLAEDAGILARVASWSRQQNFALATLADGEPIPWNLDEDQVAQVTLGGNRTINATNQRAGGFYALLAKQDATGSRQPTFGAEFDFGAFGVPGLTQTASFGDLLTFFSDGTKMMFLGITRGFDFT